MSFKMIKELTPYKDYQSKINTVNIGKTWQALHLIMLHGALCIIIGNKEVSSKFSYFTVL